MAGRGNYSRQGIASPQTFQEAETSGVKSVDSNSGWAGLQHLSVQQTQWCSNSLSPFLSGHQPHSNYSNLLSSWILPLEILPDRH